MAALLAPPAPLAAAPGDRLQDVPNAVKTVTADDLSSLPGDPAMRRILDLHNNLRSAVGAPPLRWNPDLARNATDYARVLTDTGQLVHAPRAGREQERENLALSAHGVTPAFALAEIWAREQRLFKPGIFPDVCNGDWSRCAHYTQMIWPTTTDVGCGFYAGRRFDALVCRYTPPGNRDGRPVIIAQAPAIALAPPPAANPKPAPGGQCAVAQGDDFLELLRTAAAQSGLAPGGGSDPRDAQTDLQWSVALEREQAVQDRLIGELARTQADVARGINAYLTAASAWQERYSYIASSTTGLQGLLTEWAQAKDVYEKADLAFALMNLGVGGAKLGFKAYRFMSARRAAQAAETAAASARSAETAAAAVMKGSDKVDDGLVALARQEGVDVRTIVDKAYDAADAESSLMEAIAAARGWHNLPKWAGDPITNVLLQARKVLAGVDGAAINPAQLEILKSLRTYVESRGLNFADYLRKAAGAENATTFVGKPTGLEKLKALDTDAIVKIFDEADISLIQKILDTGGDANALRNAVSPVAQASLNGVATAAQAPGVAQRAGQGACAALDSALGANRAAATPAALAGQGLPTQAQLQNVTDGLGKLGEVGLGNAVDQFGITDRFAQGQGLARATVGELWELITSPSATAASFYYTNEAQNQYLDLLTRERPKLVELGTRLDDAARALRDLENSLKRAGLDGSASYLGTRGPAELRKALDDLQRAFDQGSPEWKRRHQRQMDDRRAHITQKLADLAETLADLNALAARMGQTRAWLDSVRLGPDGKPRGPVEAFNPLTFVRLGSIALYLKGMGADNFGLTTDTPFHVVVPQSSAPAPGQSAEDFDSMRARQQKMIEEFERAPEVEVDPSLDAWLKGLEGQ